MKKQRVKGKGQASFEYILTVSVIGIMILPAAYLFYRYSQSSADQIDKAQLDKMGREIINTAESVYYQGAPSRTLLETRLPRGVLNISIIGEWNSGSQMLIITANSETGAVEFPYPSGVNINGTFNASLYELTVSPGNKRVSIEAYDVPDVPGNPSGQTTSFVFINFGGRCPRSLTYDFDRVGGVALADETFIRECNDNAVRPKYRPEKLWRDGWFNSLGSSQDAVCMNADYNGDCIVDDTDIVQFCAVSPSC